MSEPRPTRWVPSLAMAWLLPGAFVDRAAGQPCILTETTKLTAPDAEPSDSFGSEVAIEGDLLAIGAPLDDDGGPDVGAVYVYRLNGETWALETKLFPTDASENARFGAAVSTDGQVIVVGADSDGAAGSAYVYRFDGLQWIQEVKLVPPDTSIWDCFGSAVAVRGRHLIVANPCEGDVLCLGAGSAQAYRHHDFFGWQAIGKLTAPAPVCGGSFGESVGINRDSGVPKVDRIAIAAPGDNDDLGQVYLFANVFGWTLVDMLAPADLEPGANFAALSLGIKDELLAVGAPGLNGDPEAAVYVYCDSHLQTTLSPSELSGPSVLFAASVAVDAGLIVAGAPFDGPHGSAYVFRFVDGLWQETAKLLTSDDPGMFPLLGLSVAVSGQWVAAAAAGDDSAGMNAGSVYLYQLDFSDGNNNGLVDVCECPADINGDSVVDELDLIELLAAFGNAGVLPADIDLSGHVNVLDLIALLLDFDEACPTGPLG